MSHSDEREGFLRAIAEAPHEPERRLVYADWLAENEEPGEAWIQRYLASVPREIEDQLVLFRRSGQEWGRLHLPKWEEVRSLVHERFEDDRWVQAIVVSEVPRETCGLREVDLSIFMHWNVRNNEFRDVLPDNLTPGAAVGIQDLANRMKAQARAHQTKGVPPVEWT